MKLEQEKNLGPQKFTSNRSFFEIKIPNIGKKVLLKVSPDGFVSTKVETLNTANEEKLKAEAQFTEITRNLISERLRRKAAKQMPGSEEIGLELSADSLEKQFGQTAETLLGMGYTESKIKKLVMEQGKQFTIGETHMGEMPSIVKEEVMDLNTSIQGLFGKKIRK